MCELRKEVERTPLSFVLIWLRHFSPSPSLLCEFLSGNQEYTLVSVYGALLPSIRHQPSLSSETETFLSQ